MDISYIILAKQGNREAFVYIIEDIQNNLYHTALGILHNEDMARECVNETILQAYKSIKKLKHEEYFKTWITKICINICIKEYNLSKNQIDIEKVQEPFLEVHHEFIQNYLKKLDKESFIIVNLKIFNENTFSEISNILDKPVNTIKSKYYRALETLKVERRVISNESKRTISCVYKRY